MEATSVPVGSAVRCRTPTCSRTHQRAVSCSSTAASRPRRLRRATDSVPSRRDTSRNHAPLMSLSRSRICARRAIVERVVVPRDLRGTARRVGEPIRVVLVGRVGGWILPRSASGVVRPLRAAPVGRAGAGNLVAAPLDGVGMRVPLPVPAALMAVRDHPAVEGPRRARRCSARSTRASSWVAWGCSSCSLCS